MELYNGCAQTPDQTWQPIRLSAQAQLELEFRKAQFQVHRKSLGKHMHELMLKSKFNTFHLQTCDSVLSMMLVGHADQMEAAKEDS